MKQAICFEEDVNILAGPRGAFGEDPPQAAHLAIMSDADNTGGTATAFLDLIGLAPPPRQEAAE